MAKSTSKAAAKSKSSGKRTLIAPKGDKRYIKRDEKGRITESDDQSKSLAQDVKQAAKTKVKPGSGDRGDQSVKKPAPKKSVTSKASGSKK